MKEDCGSPLCCGILIETNNFVVKNYSIHSCSQSNKQNISGGYVPDNTKTLDNSRTLYALKFSPVLRQNARKSANNQGKTHNFRCQNKTSNNRTHKKQTRE